MAIVLYYLPKDEMQGDLDNIIKPILDALKAHIFVDDHQVERIVIQKFEPDRMPTLSESASAILKQLWNAERPLLYVRVSNKLDDEVA